MNQEDRDEWKSLFREFDKIMRWYAIWKILAISGWAAFLGVTFGLLVGQIKNYYFGG